MEFGFGTFRAPRRPLERLFKTEEGGWLMESDLALVWRSKGRSMDADCHSNPSTLGQSPPVEKKTTIKPQGY